MILSFCVERVQVEERRGVRIARGDMVEKRPIRVREDRGRPET